MKSYAINGMSSTVLQQTIADLRAKWQKTKDLHEAILRQADEVATLLAEQDHDLRVLESFAERGPATPEQIRKAVMALLDDVKRPLTAQQMFDRLRDYNVWPENVKQIYNALYANRDRFRLLDSARWWLPDRPIPREVI